MTGANHGGRPADPTTGANETFDEPWEDFEMRLAAYLMTMVDADERDHLLIELPGPDGDGGCTPYAQFAGFGEGTMLRAELAGNAYLLPQYRLDDAACELLEVLGWLGNTEDEKNWYLERPVGSALGVADLVVTALRDVVGIAHPQLLTYRAWGPAAEGAEDVGLCAAGAVPVDEPSAPADLPLALVAEDRDMLVGFVGDLLRAKYDTEPQVDDDGDFVLTHLEQPVWVSVPAEQPAVVVTARVAHGVHSRRTAAVEVGLLNRDQMWSRWTLRDRDVWQTLALPGLPFVPAHLDDMLDLFFAAMSSTRDDLAFRLGARVA